LNNKEPSKGFEIIGKNVRRKFLQKELLNMDPSIGLGPKLEGYQE